MVESAKKKVVITGISGFLGSYVTKMFLEEGSFAVRGTVRDKKNEKKIAPLRKAFGDGFQNLELFEADLLQPETLAAAIEGCDYVVHTASPFPLKTPKDENDLIRPAVDGTLTVLRAAEKFKVKRVVITSSAAAVMMQLPENMKYAFTEEDWSDPKACPAYEKSKTLAEKAAWDYQRNLPEDDRFELVVINPSLILGPPLIESDFTSGALVQKIMSGAFPGMPRVQFPIVDVRDVALAHLRAITVPQAKDQRFLLNNFSAWFRDVALILEKQYKGQYPIKSGELKYCTLKVASWFDSSAKVILPMWGKEFNCLNDKSKRVLGIDYQPFEKTVVDMAESMIDAGLVADKRSKK